MVQNLAGHRGDQAIRTPVELLLCDALEPVIGAQPKVAAPIVEDGADDVVDQAVLHAEVDEPSVLEAADAPVGSADPDRASLVGRETGHGIAGEPVGLTIMAGLPIGDTHQARLGKPAPDRARRIDRERAHATRGLRHRLVERRRARRIKEKHPLAVSQQHLAFAAGGRQRKDRARLLVKGRGADKATVFQPARPTPPKVARPHLASGALGDRRDIGV